MKTSVVLMVLLVSGSRAFGAEYVLPPIGVDLIGETGEHRASYEETLMDIARHYSLGYDEILQANQNVDRWLPGDDTPVVLPGRFILPDVPREGIVLNLPEKRIYYFPRPVSGQPPVVITYPAGIGRMDWATPLGVTKITAKVKDPSWRPPESIKQEHETLYGEILPDVVPPGPDNPLGRFALRLGIPGYLIHGTNKRDGVGSRVSHGCIRLYPESIEALFAKVAVGTKVRIIDEPVKVGWLAGTLFMESHDPFEEENAADQITIEAALQAIERKAGVQAVTQVDLDQIVSILEEARGIPVPILY